VRIKQLYLKAKQARANGTLNERARRFLKTRIVRLIEVAIGYCALQTPDRRLDLKSGFSDHANNRRSDPQHIHRIIDAYKASKRAQPRDGPFQIRGLWEEWIAVHYGSLVSALEQEDIASLSRQLENLFREQFTSGTGGYDNFLQFRSLFGRAYLKVVWSRYRDKLVALDFDLRKLHFPCIGNPVGVLYNDQVISIDTLRHAYHAVEIAGLVRDRAGASVVEIGGGLGGQAYQAIRLGVPKYTVFDIPEVTVVSSYFLLTAFPDKRVRLFGEDSDSGYDIRLLPHFAVAQLADSSVDLFFNSCSFSEMDGNSSREYLAIIERTCRKYFLHDNHDMSFKFRNPDGSISQNVIGSKLIPDPARYKRLYKKPRVHGLPEDRFYVHFEYLYERMADHAACGAIT
jgi:putative sugar O-methyltransferase